MGHQEAWWISLRLKCYNEIHASGLSSSSIAATMLLVSFISHVTGAACAIVPLSHTHTHVTSFFLSGTWQLHESLVALLKKMSWVSKDTNMYDYYWRNMREFGEVLTDMERRGIRVDAKDYLASVEEQARKDRHEHSKKFRQWAAGEIGVDGLALNPASATQLATFLFGGSLNDKTKQPTDAVRVFKIAREEIPDDALEAFKKAQEEQTKTRSTKGTFSRTIIRWC